ncbi:MULTISPECIES: type II toxin-antitoxin system VapC family toxin [Nostocales]|jgi:predicted nucleic acid-binding protein|uniref:Type II toxin-antitoxin system VapC family toxin n=2 Tax=Dolichospermum TaxID=748770 RepID=A0ACC7S8E6_DOLFA|nr:MULTISPECIES: type II toxin-antitoxin system VapC family toxin [Nostocales]ALB40631.1 plasmid stabilization protein [Anabaena sp. WA102]MBO1065822.1 type II toxin-antitoxin system VapC family toxin [Anabaena sp. 54]MTJ29479.1 type II toxin-antitoxin system VapC family toxin [Aphanizomenon sp. UHCC 0183]MTJ44685.1 type II toxin-antitoxin system VapC family toxin [Dolichospermum flos-aquae UHCC 0037]UUO15181.1 type II toxin-antitoxin system VapC family toxin [Dolichospermum heterosporum TAC44
MIILDTNVISELMKTQKSEIVREWVAEKPLMSMFTTTITQAEILYGIALLPEGKRRKELSQAAQLMFSEDFAGRVLAFDQNAAVAFAHIASQRRQNGTPISQADAQIAAICYTHKATIATRNVSDFEGCGISIINPWKYESV